MSDPFDRLRDELGEVAVPDQWTAIEARAALGDSAPDLPRPSRRLAWWVAAAAAVAVLLTGVIVIADLGEPAARNTGDTVPPPPVATTEPTAGRTIACDSVGALEQVLGVLSPGVAHLDYGPHSDPTSLFGGGGAVVVADLARVVRSGDYARLEFAGEPTVLAGDGPVDAISLPVPAWGSLDDVEGPDPLAAPVALRNVRVAASLRSLSAAPVWSPVLGGLFVGCAGSDVPAVDTGNQAPLVGAPSIDTIVEALQRSEAPTSSPPSLPGTPGALVTCSGAADLDAVVEVLRSGLPPTPEYQPAGSLGELLTRSAGVVYGTLRSAMRSGPPEDGSAGFDPPKFTQISLSAVEVLAGGTAVRDVMGFELASAWSVRTGADPLGWSSTFDGLAGVSVVAFLVESDDVPGGWTVDPQGWFVACDAAPGPVRSVLEPAGFLDDSSIDALADSVRLAVAPDPELFGGTCIDRTVPYSGSPSDPAEWDTFGPLGAEPGLRIALPIQAGATAATTSIERVPGGVLVVARVSDATRNGAVVALVGHDGAVKWRRCLLGYVSLLAGSNSSVKLHIDPDGAEEARWEGLDVATGQLGETVGYGWPIARTDQFALFEVQPGASIGPESRLVRVDLFSDHTVELPYPPETFGQGVAIFRLVDTNVEGGAVPVLVVNRAPVSAYVDGEWGALDPARHPALEFVVARLSGEVNATFDWATGSRLSARNGLGEVVWERPDLWSHGTEGFASVGPVGSGDGVVLVRACLEPPATERCAYEATQLMAVSAADGHTLWQTGAPQSVVLASGDFAVVTVAGSEPPSFELIDVNTGVRVAGSPTWDPAAFSSECCGGGDYFRVGREGALAWTLAADYWSAEPDPYIDVWYPAGATAATIDVDLLG